MPRKKKPDQSPARLPGGPLPDRGSLSVNPGYQAPPPGTQPATPGGFNLPSSSSSSDRDSMVQSMKEMFSHLDPEVIYIVLSECDFKVENAMDSLLELSVAAEIAAPVPPPVSGFERTAAALLSPHHVPEVRPDSDVSNLPQEPSSPPSSNVLTEELDLLLDQELESLTAQQDLKEKINNSQFTSTDPSSSSFPLPPFTQQALPELLQSSMETGSRGLCAEQVDPVGGLGANLSGASSPFDKLSRWDDKATKGQQPVVDFRHLMTDAPPDKAKSNVDLAASGRPSAFQLYKKQEPSQAASEQGNLLHPAAIGGARSKVNPLNQELLGNMSSSWNLGAPVFLPRIPGNQEPAFINPVAQIPSNWPGKPRLPWVGPVSQAPLKHNATVPKSWTMAAASQASLRQNRLQLEGRVLVLLRGAPGSGKSTLARALLENNPGGVVLSTDEYFFCNGQYHFDPSVLGEAHGWNHRRAKEAFEKGKNPIIIDNTNLQGWEMRPYVVQALRHGYKVLFREPDTWWKNKPRELERRTRHNVPVESIRRMLNGYERYVTIHSIMGSQMPERKDRVLPENECTLPPSSETLRPDLVGQPGSVEEYKKSHPQLFSSLPDVSSIGHPGELEDTCHQSTESLNFQPNERPTNHPGTPDGEDIDLGELDAELEAHFSVNNPSGDQRIPDCIVESVMSEDNCGDEIPVAFSNSIKQRVKRERLSRRSGFEKMEPLDLVKDTNQSGSEANRIEALEDEKEECQKSEKSENVSKLLDFVGDWPSEAPLQQRHVRKRESPEVVCRQGSEASSQVANNMEKTPNERSGPNIAEFQKLLDLIQTGITTDQTDHSCTLSPSPTSREDSESGNETQVCSEETHGSRYDSEERKQDRKAVASSRGELPDCVVDWNAADSCNVTRAETDDKEEIKIEVETSNIAEGNTTAPEVVSESLSVDLNSTCVSNPISALSEDLSVLCKTSEVCQGGVESQSIDTEAGIDLLLNSCSDEREARTEADDSQNSDMCQSPGFEAENNSLTGGSQDRKQRPGRRSGKQCKLALTFTQNYPDSSGNTLDSPDTATPNPEDNKNSFSSDITPNSDPNTSVDTEQKSELMESKSEADLQQLQPWPRVDTASFTQTEPHDFALLWRLNRQDSSDDAVVTAVSSVTVRCGDASHFVPENVSAESAAVAVHPSGHREVPYRVVHEKGTQVEEKEFGVTQDRLESLRILSRHFKLVSFDTLEDLYDKCHQDLEWTTNLLLDSGERFYRDEDSVEEVMAAEEKDYSKSRHCGASQEAAETSLCPNVLGEHQHEDWLNREATVGMEKNQPSNLEAASGSDEGTSNTNVLTLGGAAISVTNQLDSIGDPEKTYETDVSVSEAVKEEEKSKDTEDKEPDLEVGAWGGSFDKDGVIIEDLRVEIDDEIASMDEVNRLLQAELDEIEKEEKQRKEQRRNQHLHIQSVEVKLPTELALQLTELFGPVGVDPATCSAEDYEVQMDLNLAKLLHQKWKETIQERQRQATLSFHLLQESLEAVKPGQRDWTPPSNFLTGADGYTSVDSQHDAWGQMPPMDHWNVSRPHVSLRDIIKEEQALQRSVEKTRQSRAEIDRRDGATLLKENQLYSLFPNIDKHFLQDIFRDHNYSLTQTEVFLHSLLIEEPVKTVIAPEVPRIDHHRAASKEREKRQKPFEAPDHGYQDTEDPEYEDFRAEASLQRRRQLESFSKAAEAYKQGRKEVASFYAQQGHLHGQRMREANHRAAAQIFERVNSSLLPNNILDLHGLHVDEALQHLSRVIQDKTKDYEQGLCRPQLSVITGRGNHSQGGVARIRPAVVDYLTNKHYRFSEPKPGLVLVSLK